MSAGLNVCAMNSSTALQAAAVGSEFAFIIIASGFMGYFIGDQISAPASVIGLTLGLFLGMAGGIYRMYLRFK